MRLTRESDVYELLPGDVVRLERGGPLMTVAHVTRWLTPRMGGPDVLCEWFAGDELRVRGYAPRDLLLVQAAAPVPEVLWDGELVRLASGGPTLTVKAFKPYRAGFGWTDSIFCQWDRARLRGFPLAVLVR